VPDKYLKERQALLKKGMPLAAAKTKAARDYNRTRGSAPPILSSKKYSPGKSNKKK
jgi:hypothetical protein